MLCAFLSFLFFCYRKFHLLFYFVTRLRLIITQAIISNVSFFRLKIIPRFLERKQKVMKTINHVLKLQTNLIWNVSNKLSKITRSVYFLGNFTLSFFFWKVWNILLPPSKYWTKYHSPFSFLMLLSFSLLYKLFNNLSSCINYIFIY